MIEEPPLLTIAVSRNRPTEAQIAALATQPTGFLCDAQGGSAALSHEIKPFDPAAMTPALSGPALTVQCCPGDLLPLLAALDEIKPGDVLVVATGGWKGCAVLGDRVMGMAKNNGAAGVVTDGLARDYRGITDIGLPLFCAGISPNSPFAKSPGSIGLPVTVGGRMVSTGDMVVADRDGVVTVPFGELDTVIGAVEHVAELEHALDAEVAAGLKLPDAIREFLASDQVSRV